MAKILDCFHCGNKTPMDIIALNTKRYHFEYSWEDISYFIYQCPVCEQVVLEKTSLYREDILYYSDDAFEQRECEEEATRRTILYPTGSFNKAGIPEKVQNAFESALKVKNIDLTIFTMAIRMTLEMICNDQKAEGPDLHNKLKDLSKKRVLPRTLGDVAFLIKKLGNEAAHTGEISNITAQQLIEFTEYILDYIYRIPYNLQRLKRNTLV